LSYSEFLASKREVVEPVGFDLSSPIDSRLFPFQRDVTEWAIRRGRSAVFADCGLGKSAIEAQWADRVCDYTKRNVLILTPLAVAKQLARECEKFGVKATVCRDRSDVRPGVNIANYERLHRFDSNVFDGIVLDESSILKAFDGKTRKAIIGFARGISHRLAATATPAPNELIELMNHAEFLDLMSPKEMLATFFRQDGNSTQKWRLKGHAEEEFWKWMASWSVAIRKPSDLGYSDDGFLLPPLEMEEIVVSTPPPPGMVFATGSGGIQERRASRRASLQARVNVAAERAMSTTEPYLLWCDLNDESEALRKSIPDAVEVRGSDNPEAKERALLGFADGSIRVLVTKPSIAGWGLNWQHCYLMDFVGLSDSFEQEYQAIRRCYRFGQEHSVRVGLIVGENETGVIQNLQRKERQAAEMFDGIVRHMSGLSLGRTSRDEMDYRAFSPMVIPQWLSRVS
jgi:hypothetical protein